MHRRVEYHLGLHDQTWTARGYCGLLETLWQIYIPLERALRALDWRDCGIKIEDRCKAGWIEADLAHFGVETKLIAALKLSRDWPQLDTVATGLGALYVLEGSTLGGRVILDTLGKQLDISGCKGGRFFAGYGADAGTMWQAYLAVLERQGQSLHAAAEIEQGAMETFRAFENHFECRSITWIAGGEPIELEKRPPNALIAQTRGSHA